MISVRLDPEAEKALRLLESTGLTRSEAIRSSVVEAAARLRSKARLAVEIADLEADADDVAEMLAVAEFMETLRAPR
jgi:Arc/MetJ-type ribon-helix-helix transcriptional regulator